MLSIFIFFITAIALYNLEYPEFCSTHMKGHDKQFHGINLIAVDTFAAPNYIF